MKVHRDTLRLNSVLRYTSFRISKSRESLLHSNVKRIFVLAIAVIGELRRNPFCQSQLGGFRHALAILVAPRLGFRTVTVLGQTGTAHVLVFVKEHSSTKHRVG